MLGLLLLTAESLVRPLARDAVRTFWTWGVAVVLLAIAGWAARRPGPAPPGRHDHFDVGSRAADDDGILELRLRADGHDHRERVPPGELVSSQGLAVTLINESGVAQTVSSTTSPSVRTHPSGGGFVYRPRLPVSITYHSGLHQASGGCSGLLNNQT